MRYAPILFLALAATARGASTEMTFTENRTFTVPGDVPFTYDLTAEMTYFFNDRVNRAFVTDFSYITTPDLPPFTRVSKSSVFIPGTFPEPGHIGEKITTRIVDFDAVSSGQFAPLGVPLPVTQDASGFFFGFSHFMDTDIILKGMVTISTSIDGSEPRIVTKSFFDTNLKFTTAGGRFRINPDLTLSQIGSFFRTRRVEGIDVAYVFVPEPSGLLLIWMAMIAIVTLRQRVF